jgi:hypothetical protein
MPSRLETLPDDVQTAIYEYLYSYILADLMNSDDYRNTKYFHNLLEITGDPLVCDLDYLGMSNLNNSKYDILKYKRNKKEYDELFNNNAIYQRSYYIKQLDIALDKIVISNDAFLRLYKYDKTYYRTIKEHIQFNICKDTTITRKINKATFVLQQSEPFKCLAELLYHVIDFYNIIKNKIHKHIEMLELLENGGQILTSRQRKDKYIMQDMLNYHINNRFIVRFDYDIDSKTAIPILRSL